MEQGLSISIANRYIYNSFFCALYKAWIKSDDNFPWRYYTHFEPWNVLFHTNRYNSTRFYVEINTIWSRTWESFKELGILVYLSMNNFKIKIYDILWQKNMFALKLNHKSPSVSRFLISDFHFYVNFLYL